MIKSLDDMSSNHALAHKLHHRSKPTLGGIVLRHHALATRQLTIAARIEQQTSDAQVAHTRGFHQSRLAFIVYHINLLHDIRKTQQHAYGIQLTS